MRIDMMAAFNLAEAIVRRENAQPIPLSQEETLLLAHALYYRTLRYPNEEITEQINTAPNYRSKANTRQVAGQHYGLTEFQHWDMVVMFKLDYFQGQITKYVMRWREKNGVEDLHKAAHYLEKYIEADTK